MLRDGVAIKVRERKITEIISMENYSYGGVPVINGRGFEVLAKSENEIRKFLSEYSKIKGSDQKNFFAKWVRFDTFRKVIISKNI